MKRRMLVLFLVLMSTQSLNGVAPPRPVESTPPLLAPGAGKGSGGAVAPGSGKAGGGGDGVSTVRLGL